MSLTKSESWFYRTFDDQFFGQKIAEIISPVMDRLNKERDRYRIMDLRKSLIKAVASSYWEPVDRKTSNPHFLIRKYMPPWVIFTLPRRPAFVLFAAYQDVLQKQIGNYEEYLSTIAEYKWFVKEFMKLRLNIYHLTSPVRKILGLWEKDHPEVDKPWTKDLPRYLENILLAYSTPSSIFHQVASFVENKSLQQGISFIRGLEEFSSNLSSAESVDDIIFSFEELNTKRTRLEQIDVTLKELKSPDLSFLDDKEWFDDFQMRFEKVPPKDQKQEEPVEPKEGKSPLEKAKDEVARKTFSNDPYGKKKKHYRASKLYPYWKKLERFELYRSRQSRFDIELHYEICIDEDYYCVASKSRFISTYGDTKRWRTDAKYYRWFPTKEKAQDWMMHKVSQKKVKGYNVQAHVTEISE